MESNKVSDGGKGSAQRPLGVDQKTFEENWDAIFTRGDGNGLGGLDDRAPAGDCGGAHHGSEVKSSKPGT